MIRRKTGGGWLLFAQDDHARLSAEIMSLWGGGFFFTSPSDDLLFAISEHDCGWKEADSSPVLNPDGVPESFTEVPPQKQCDIWRRSFNAHSTARPEACALIALHFKKFNDRVLSRGENKWSLALRREIDEFVARSLCVESVEDIPARVERDLRLLQTGDALSLVLCHGWESFEMSGVPLENGGEETVRLTMTDENIYSASPWPFSRGEDLSFEIGFTRVRGDKFDSNAQLLKQAEGRTGEKMVFCLSPENA
ncbi:MAG: DUF3891 family protein [Candidatus Mycalebacterium zealandia]|nr:MAG: DUF3891 family protein [Candidatus Mycalebacterium zealandia]